jgi:hypothetical protein
MYKVKVFNLLKFGGSKKGTPPSPINTGSRPPQTNNRWRRQPPPPLGELRTSRRRPPTNTVSRPPPQTNNRWQRQPPPQTNNRWTRRQQPPLSTNTASRPPPTNTRQQPPTNTVSRPPSGTNAIPASSVNSILTTNRNIFSLFDVIRQEEKILIIDFENIKNALNNVAENTGQKREFENKIDTLNLQDKQKRWLKAGLADERQALEAWLFIIKYYALHQNLALRYDKIIVVCKQKTWDEWFDYAFGKFAVGPALEALKNRFFIVNLKLTPRRHQLGELQHMRLNNITYAKAFMGLDDYMMYFIKLYLNNVRNIPDDNVTILTLDQQCADDFIVYQSMINQFRTGGYNNNMRFNPNSFKCDLTISRGRLAFHYNRHPQIKRYPLEYANQPLIFNNNFLNLLTVDDFPATSTDVITTKYSNYNYRPQIINFNYTTAVSSVHEIFDLANIVNQVRNDYDNWVVSKGGPITREHYNIEHLRGPW